MITTVAVVTQLRLHQELLAAAVGSRAGFAVIAVSSNETQASEMLAVQHPDIALLDAGLPSVWTVAQSAKQAGVRVLLFGLVDRPQPIQAAEQAGCEAVLLTSATSREVIDCLERLRTLETYPGEHPVDLGPIATLTARELEVLALIAEGLSNKEIASKLTVSLPTVKTHVHNVLFKLGARRRVDAGRLLHVATSSAAAEPHAIASNEAELMNLTLERRLRASLG
jgi:DNA-binding NarL/FixJ family response regulator